MDLFALATLPAAADEVGGPPSIKFYELRDNLLERPWPVFDEAVATDAPPPQATRRAGSRSS
jgi:hypothetical protein